MAEGKKYKKQKTNKQTKKHYLNWAPGSVLPWRCQKYADVFHLFVCQRCPAEVTGSGGAGELQVARLFFFLFLKDAAVNLKKRKKARQLENLSQRRCKNIGPKLKLFGGGVLAKKQLAANQEVQNLLPSWFASGRIRSLY